MTRLDGRSGAAITRKALLGYGLAKLVPGLLTLISVPIWIHAIGAAEYAAFSLVWILTSVTTMLGLGWVGQAALRCAGDPSRALGRLPRAPLVAAVLLPVLPVAVWALAASAGRSPARTAGLLITATFFCAVTGAYSLVATRAQRDQRATRFAIAEGVRVAGSLLSSLWLLRQIPGAAGILAGNVVGTGLAAGVLIGSSAPGMLSARPTSRPLLHSYWRYGWPMSLWLGTSVVLVYVDRFVIASIMGNAVAGRYAAIADTITRGIGMFAFPITVAAHSAVMTEWNTGGLARARSALASAARMQSVVLVVCVAATAFLGPWALGMLVPGPTPGRGTVIVLAVGAALWQCALLGHKPLEIAGRSRLMLGLMLVVAVLTVGLDLVLVPLAGLAGAATGFACGAGCYAGACLLIGSSVLRRYSAAQRRQCPTADRGTNHAEETSYERNPVG